MTCPAFTLSRLKDLQIASSRELAIEFEAEVPKAAARGVEKIAHTLLAAKRTRGEWFSASIDEAIAAVKTAIVQWKDARASAVSHYLLLAHVQPNESDLLAVA